jgi:hypothetical protein
VWLDGILVPDLTKRRRPRCRANQAAQLGNPSTNAATSFDVFFDGVRA